MDNVNEQNFLGVTLSEVLVSEWRAWNGMDWNGMEWNGMEWNEIVCSKLMSDPPK